MSAQAVLTWVVIPALIALAIVVFALIGRLLIDPASAKPSPAVEFRFLGAAAAVVLVLVVLALVLLLP
jgi:hypothetical protein